MNIFKTTRSILREERSALRLKTISSLLLPHHYGQKSATPPETLFKPGMALHSWSARAFSSLFFISSVMTLKPGLQCYRGNNLPRACHQVLSKSSGCRALQALRQTRESPPTYETPGRPLQSLLHPCATKSFRNRKSRLYCHMFFFKKFQCPGCGADTGTNCCTHRCDDICCAQSTVTFYH